MSLGLETGQWTGSGGCRWAGREAGWVRFTSARRLSGLRALTCEMGSWTE